MINAVESTTSESTPGYALLGMTTQGVGVKVGVTPKTAIEGEILPPLKTGIAIALPAQPKRESLELTESRIRSLGKKAKKEGIRELKASDATTKGLVLVSKDNGVQEWRYRFKQHEKDRVITLGKYPALTLSQARQKALEARQKVETGEDINETKRAARQPFSAFLDAFYKRWEPGKRKGSILIVQPKVELLKRKLGDVPVSLITTGKIADALEGEAASVVHRCLHICQASLRIAVVQNAVQTNAARELTSADIHSAPKVKVPRNSVPLADVRAVVEKVSGRSVVASDALMLMALCATRAEETTLAEWEHIDWENKLWNIPAENRKGKLDIRHPLAVPLSDMAVSLLERISKKKLSAKWIFPGNMCQRIDRRTVLHNLKLVSNSATLHGFRHAFSTAANNAGFDGIVNLIFGDSCRTRRNESKRSGSGVSRTIKTTSDIVVGLEPRNGIESPARVRLILPLAADAGTHGPTIPRRTYPRGKFRTTGAGSDKGEAGVGTSPVRHGFAAVLHEHKGVPAWSPSVLCGCDFGSNCGSKPKL
jgi:integrase